MTSPLPPTDGPTAVLMRTLVADRVTQIEAATAMREFFDGCRSLDASGKQRECDALTMIVDRAPIGPACYLSVAIGGLIEQGAAPGPFAESLHRMLGEVLPRTVHLARETESLERTGCHNTASNEEARAEQHARALEDASAAHPLSREAWDHFGVLWSAGVATYCREPAARRKAREFLPLVQRIRDCHEGGFWLTQLLSVLDNEPLIVLDIARRVGIVARVSGCADNDQLHTLLLDTFPRRWYERRRVTPTALAVAQGTGPQQIHETVTGRWNLYQATALHGEGHIPPSRLQDPHHGMIGEGLPSDIPLIDGTRVVLLGSPTDRRRWNSSRKFNDLPAGLSDVRVLTKEELVTWIARIMGQKANGP